MTHAAVKSCPFVTKTRVKRGYRSLVRKCALTPVAKREPFNVMLARWCDEAEVWCTKSEKKDVEAIKKWHKLV